MPVLHRLLTLPLIAAIVVSATMTGCKGSKRNDVLAGDQIIRASNEQGVEVAITRIRQHRKHVVLNIDLTNNSEQVVELRNPGDTMRGFMVQANGRTVAAQARHGGYWGPWVGYRPGSESSAAGVMELAPGTTAGLELHFRWPRPYQDRHDYDWKLTVSQMFAKGGNEGLDPIVTAPASQP